MRIKITEQQWKKLQKEFNYKCVRCGLNNYYLDKDHIKPFYQGGKITIKNIQPLCAWCNASKGKENFNWKKFRRKYGWIKIPLKLPQKHPFNL